MPATPPPVVAARFYRRMGWNALPSKFFGERSHPPMTYSHYWDRPINTDWFARYPEATNVQVMCGVRWRLAVIDLDGPDALGVWAGWWRGRTPVRTWESAHGPGGRHVWYTIPAGMGPMPKRTLWEDTGRRHTKVEFLGDRSLVMAPPSVHRSGEPYRFLPGRTPLDLPRPAPIPDWLAGLADPAPRRPVQRLRLEIDAPGVPVLFRRQDVLDAIPDKIALAASWGVRLAATRPNPSGWQRCHAIDRPDRDPSAALSVRGDYWDAPFGKGHSLSLFDLSVAMGVCPDWKSSVNYLGHMFGARRQEPQRVRA